MTNVDIYLKDGSVKTVNDLQKITKNDFSSNPITEFDTYSFTADAKNPITDTFIGKTSTMVIPEKEIINVDFTKED